MAMPTVLQTLLAVVFAALGFVGFWVSIHPPGTQRVRRVYLGMFVSLTLLGVVLVVWQARLAERSQAAGDAAADELRRQVAVLYRSQTVIRHRPTQDEVDDLADRAYALRREEFFRGHPDLVLRTQIIAADIRAFAAERAKDAPRVESLGVSQRLSELVDDMKVPPPGEPLSMDEMRDQANRRYRKRAIDPFEKAGLSEEEKSWFLRNRAGLEYHLQTRRLFDDKFLQPLADVLSRLLTAGIIEKRFATMAPVSYSYNERGMSELAFRLDEAAERLAAKQPGAQ